MRWVAWTVMGIGAVGIVYSIYAHYHPTAAGLPAWAYLLAATWLLVGLDIYDRKSKERIAGRIIGAWRGGFVSPRFDIINDHKFENEEIAVDNKSFRRCGFKNVKLLYHGRAPFEFLDETIVDAGSVIFTTDDPAIILFDMMQSRFGSLPGAQVQRGVKDNKGMDVSLLPLKVEQINRDHTPEVFKIEDMTVDPPSVNPAVVYKDKVRLILTNVFDREVSVWTPLWVSDQVNPQYPIGSLFRLQGAKGWKHDDWQEEEKPCVTLPIGQTLSCWIGLQQPTGTSLKVRHQRGTQLGTAIFPVKIDGKLYEVPIPV